MQTFTRTSGPGLRIAVVDYGAGNLRSVAKALERLGHRPIVTSEHGGLRSAEGVVFPGQGIARPAMQRLKSSGMHEALRDAVAGGTPFFGVCLGLQLLFDTSEEGDTPCLGILPGKVVRFPAGLKVPHMGWNTVTPRMEHPLFQGMEAGTQFYFVHSYYGVPADPGVIAAETEYGVTFASAVASKNMVATQFHPEKSGDPGLRLYDNFFRSHKESAGR